MEESISKRSAVVIVVIAVLVGLTTYLFLRSRQTTVEVVAPVVKEVKKSGPKQEIIGRSVEGRKIEAFTYGLGEQINSSSTKSLLFVGGIHGGYEWNSVLLAYDLIDFLNSNPNVIPRNERITVIPNANPDGVYKVVGKEGRFTISDVPKTGDQSPGRFNANGVDLNRNFDCNWSPKGTWRSKAVDTGTKAFSEPESVVLRDYIMSAKPDVAVFYHSQANAVYASQCNDGILPDTLKVMDAYAKATGYKAVKTFDAYAVNGASEDWLASVGIPAITVELKTHEDVEWEKNLLGINALIKYYSLN